VDLPWLEDVVRAKRPQYLPVVLTRDETRAVLQRLDGVPRIMALLLYSAGLRLLECCRPRVKDVDFAASHIVIRDGKGRNDRVTLLPGARAHDPGIVAAYERTRLSSDFKAAQHHAPAAGRQAPAAERARWAA
jgi:integrase